MICGVGVADIDNDEDDPRADDLVHPWTMSLLPPSATIVDALSYHAVARSIWSDAIASLNL